jgi:two-component system chemotaxis sensor kinase CheA
MIEDKELRELFQVECEEHFTVLEKGFLDLEENPNQPELLHSVFREAHSLKGASRMLGLSDIETISHLLEDELGKASKGIAPITSDRIDVFYFATDALKKLVKEAVQGEKSDANVIKVVEVLKGTSSLPTKKKAHQVEEPEVKATVAPKQAKPVEEETSTPTQVSTFLKKPSTSLPPAPAKTEKYKIDTMRVEPAKLDILMSLIGELTVSKNRIMRRVKEIEDIFYIYEELDKTHNDIKNIIKSIPDHKHHLEDRLNSSRDRIKSIGVLLQTLKIRSNSDSTKLESLSNKLEEGIQNIRLLPLSNVFQLFNRTVRDLGRETEKEIQFIVEGGETTADKGIIEELKDPLMHLIRNCIDHGIEPPEERKAIGKHPTASLSLIGKTVQNSIQIQVGDDGRGLSKEKLKDKAVEKGLYTYEELNEFSDEKIYQIIFLPGFSTKSEVTDLSGRGVGMDVVKNFVDQMKGSISIDSTLGKGTTFTLHLPIRFSTTHVLLCDSGGVKIAIPAENVVQSSFIRKEDIFLLQGKSNYSLGGDPVSIFYLEHLLFGHNSLPNSSESLSCVFIKDNDNVLGIIVDEILDKQEVILKPFSGIIRRVRNVSGTTLLESGDICSVLNIQDIFRSANKHDQYRITTEMERKETPPVLVVEDSHTTRAQISRILESGGFKVTQAINGKEAMEKLNQGKFKIILSDIEMPEMDGLTFTKELRKMENWKKVPIVLLSSLSSPQSIQAGMDAGATAYMVKSNFEQSEFLATIERLLKA